MLAIPSRVIASCFALVSFAAAVLEGAAVGNPLLTILLRATVIMIIAWAVGSAIGAVAQRTVDQHIEAYRQANPIPTDQIGASASVEPDVDTADNVAAQSPSTEPQPTTDDSNMSRNQAA